MVAADVPAVGMGPEPNDCKDVYNGRIRRLSRRSEQENRRKVRRCVLGRGFGREGFTFFSTGGILPIFCKKNIKLVAAEAKIVAVEANDIPRGLKPESVLRPLRPD
jgi:hypothetical protein